MEAAGRHVPITRTPRTEGPASIRRGPEGGIELSSHLAPVIGRAGDRYDVRLGDTSYLFERHEMLRLTIDAGARAKDAKVERDVDVPVRLRDDAGHERVLSSGVKNAPAQTKQGTIKIFGRDWGNVGVLSSNMISPDLTAIRGKAQSQVLDGVWSASARVGPNAWSLDATAEMLAGGLRC